MFWLLFIASLFLACAPPQSEKKESNTSTQATEKPQKNPGRSALLPFANTLLKRLSSAERAKDVTCWTSFQQFDWAIAHRRYDRHAAIVKTKAMSNLTRALWKRAQENPKERVFALPQSKQEQSQVNDYIRTFEPLRILLSITQENIHLRPNDGLAPLNEAAIKSLESEISIMAFALLKAAGDHADSLKEKEISSASVRHAYKKIAQDYKLQNETREIAPLGLAEIQKTIAPLSGALIRQKEQALVRFNSAGALVDDINKIRKKEFDKDAIQLFASRIMADVASVTAGVELMRGDNFIPTGGQPVANAARDIDYIDMNHVAGNIEQLFPHLVDSNGDVHIYFVPSPGIRSPMALKAHQFDLLDHEMNAIRDTGFHWFALARVHERVPFAIDPFAAELLSENASIMMTYYLKRAEGIADFQKRDKIDAAIAQQVLSPAFSQVPANKNVAWDKGQNVDSKKLAAFAKIFKIDNKSLPKFVAKTVNVEGEGRVDIQRIAGGGVGLGFANEDGLVDIAFSSASGVKLWINDNKKPGSFIDQSQALPNKGRSISDGRATLFFDSDGDGDQELLVVRTHSPSLLLERNEQGQWKNVAPKRRFMTNPGAHCATIVDANQDGLSDIFVGYYGSLLYHRKQSEKNSPSLDGRNGISNEIFLAQKNGSYRRDSSKAIKDDVGWALACAAFDYERDGDADIYVANDFGRNRLFRNDEGKFVEVGQKTHTDDRGSGMSSTFADINKDGFWDVYVSNIDMFSKRIKVVFPTDEKTIDFDKKVIESFQYVSGNQFYLSDGPDSFQQQHEAKFEPGDPGWSWDAAFFDADGDGDEDFYLANGFIQNSLSDAQQNKLYLNENGRFHAIDRSSQAQFSANSRSAAFADFDQDGDIDVFINNFASVPTYLRNGRKGRRQRRLLLRGKGKNTDAFGATVEIDCAGKKSLHQKQSARGYLGQYSPAIMFACDGDAKAEVTWPDGSKEKTLLPAGEKSFTLQERRAD